MSGVELIMANPVESIAVLCGVWVLFLWATTDPDAIFWVALVSILAFIY